MTSTKQQNLQRHHLLQLQRAYSMCSNPAFVTARKDEIPKREKQTNQKLVRLVQALSPAAQRRKIQQFLKAYFPVLVRVNDPCSSEVTEVHGGVSQWL